MRLTICHLYPELMNLYGDRGNVIALARRCQWHGMEVDIKESSLRDGLGDWDILFLGGGQDKEQSAVCRDLCEQKAPRVIEGVNEGRALLAVCGGYQLLGRYFKTGTGETIPGIGLFDAWTVAGDRRCIGDVIVECELDGERRTLVGFENHSGKTYLGKGLAPLGRVLFGHGNNAEDRTEGAVYKNAIGTYLHGSLLPKNPWLADRLILAALRRRYGEDVALAPLDDAFEQRAHAAVVERIRQRGKMDTGAGKRPGAAAGGGRAR